MPWPSILLIGGIIIGVIALHVAEQKGHLQWVHPNTGPVVGWLLGTVVVVYAATDIWRDWQAASARETGMPSGASETVKGAASSLSHSDIASGNAPDSEEARVNSGSPGASSDSGSIEIPEAINALRDIGTRMISQVAAGKLREGELWTAPYYAPFCRAELTGGGASGVVVTCRDEVWYDLPRAGMWAGHIFKYMSSEGPSRITPKFESSGSERRAIFEASEGNRCVISVLDGAADAGAPGRGKVQLVCEER